MAAQSAGSGPEPGAGGGGRPSPALLRAARRILGPLVRLFIREGLTFPSLAALLKTVYVEQADRHFALPGKATTDSRVALLTGVHRKDVARLRSGDEPEDVVTPSLGAQVLGRWIGHPDYGDASGPSGLDRARFDRLVAEVSKDVRPRALLDELLAAGQVREAEDGRLEVVTAAHLPQGDHDKMLHYLGRNVGDHLTTAVHNLGAEGPPMFERALFHDGLTAESVEHLRAQAEHEIMEVLVRLNRRATELGEADLGRPDADRRFVAGLYLTTGPQTEEGP